MIDIQFSQEEMKEFILKESKYEIKSVTYTHTYTEHHNRVVEEERMIEIAHPTEIPLENFLKGKDDGYTLGRWSVESVFERELKSKLLNL